MLTTFGSASKHLYLIGGLVLEAALTACAGVLYVVLRAPLVGALATRRGGERPAPMAQTSLSYADTPFIIFTLWLLSAGLLAPLIGGGFFGTGLVGGAKMTLLSQLAPDLVFALSFISQARTATRERVSDASEGRISRRSLLWQGTVAAATLGGGIAIWQALTSGLGALVGASPAPSPPPSLSLSDIPERIAPPPIPVYSDFAP